MKNQIIKNIFSKKYFNSRFNCYFLCFVSGFLYAVAIKYFIFPSKVIMTGTEGLAISTAYYFNNENIFPWLYAGFQICLLLFAFIKIGGRFALRTSVVIAVVILFLNILPEFTFANPEPTNERILLVIFGGILAGFAKAIAFRQNASTGDEDIPAAYLSMKHLKPVGNIAVIAAFISTAYGMLLAYLKYGDFEVIINTLMYSAIYIFMSAETLNNFYHKFKIVLVNIITKKSKIISSQICNSLPHRTFTLEKGVGGYSNTKVDILRLIVTQEELSGIIEIIEDCDAEVFYFFNNIEGVTKNYYISPIK